MSDRTFGRKKAGTSTIFNISFQRNAPTTAIGRLGDCFIVLQAHIEVGITSAIVFAVGNLDTTIQAIEQQGGNLQKSPYSDNFGEAVMLTDPDGLPLEFITPSPELNMLQ